jgi:hypothetical protein
MPFQAQEPSTLILSVVLQLLHLRPRVCQDHFAIYKYSILAPLFIPSEFVNKELKALRSWWA